MGKTREQQKRNQINMMQIHHSLSLSLSPPPLFSPPSLSLFPSSLSLPPLFSPLSLLPLSSLPLLSLYPLSFLSLPPLSSPPFSLSLWGCGGALADFSCTGVAKLWLPPREGHTGK